MNLHPFRQRQSAFTLVEIMVVCLIVGILSALSLAAISRIKEKTARSVIHNNLRQYYQAKEYYYAETGTTKASSIITLEREGYISKSLKDRLLGHASYESKMGWHYRIIFTPGMPTTAFQGRLVTGSVPTGEVIYYPAGEYNPQEVFRSALHP